jgi:hypothetical protein
MEDFLKNNKPFLDFIGKRETPKKAPSDKLAPKATEKTVILYNNNSKRNWDLSLLFKKEALI